jgi:hypothetical protein
MKENDGGDARYIAGTFPYVWTCHNGTPLYNNYMLIKMFLKKLVHFAATRFLVEF